jgi:hypothetical protein
MTRAPESDGRKEAGEQTGVDFQIHVAEVDVLLEVALANALAHTPEGAKSTKAGWPAAFILSSGRRIARR